MSKLARGLRQRTAAAVAALPMEARIELALRLGDEDLARFVAASGLDRNEALRRLRAGRQRGRVPSVCASAEK